MGFEKFFDLRFRFCRISIGPKLDVGARAEMPPTLFKWILQYPGIPVHEIVKLIRRMGWDIFKNSGYHQVFTSIESNCLTHCLFSTSEEHLRHLTRHTKTERPVQRCRRRSMQKFITEHLKKIFFCTTPF